MHGIDIRIALFGIGSKYLGLRRVWVLLKGLPGWGTPSQSNGSVGEGTVKATDPSAVDAFLREHIGTGVS